MQLLRTRTGRRSHPVLSQGVERGPERRTEEAAYDFHHHPLMRRVWCIGPSISCHGRQLAACCSPPLPPCPASLAFSHSCRLRSGLRDRVSSAMLLYIDCITLTSILLLLLLVLLPLLLLRLPPASCIYTFITSSSLAGPRPSQSHASQQRSPRASPRTWRYIWESTQHPHQNDRQQSCSALPCTHNRQSERHQPTRERPHQQEDEGLLSCRQAVVLLLLLESSQAIHVETHFSQSGTTSSPPLPTHTLPALFLIRRCKIAAAAPVG